MRLVLVGTSHHLAPVELRERVELRGPISARSSRPARGAGDGEAVALSTCNRTCLYVVHADAGEAQRRAIYGALAEIAGLSAGRARAALYTRRRRGGRRTTSSASPPGSTRWSPARRRSSARCGARTRRRARRGRRVRCCTGSSRRRFTSASGSATRPAIGENPASVSSAAAELATQRLRRARRPARPRPRRGQDGRADRREPRLARRRRSSWSPTARPSGREALARALRRPRGRARRARAPSSIEADVVVASTGSQRARARRGRVRPSARCGERRGRPIFFIDIAVPRDLDPAINELDGCYLYDIDDLERVVAGERRRPTRRGRARRGDRRRGGGRVLAPGSARSTSCRRSRRSARSPRTIRAAELARAERRLGPSLRVRSAARSRR